MARWGLISSLKDVSSSPEEFTIHRYSDGEILGRRDKYGKEMLEKYGSPFWDMHRADLQLACYERAVALGVEFRFGAVVTNVDVDAPSVTLANGEIIRGSLIIAADGMFFLWILEEC